MGAFEEAKGKAKEAVGSVTGSDELREEGQAQQRKADEERRAERARTDAERHETRAETHERSEEHRQGT
jgi:uncharacterized protein YjbJ (UPF0337 family)